MRRQVSIQEKVSIVLFDPKYSPAFTRLNLQWIEKYFKVEEADVKQLSQPEKIVADGGQVIFALSGDRAIGTCAMIPLEDGAFELAKMAVNPNFQGYGIGDKLMDFSEKWALQQGATVIKISSNTELKPALTLYEKKGFVKLPGEVKTEYARCNIQLEKTLAGH